MELNEPNFTKIHGTGANKILNALVDAVYDSNIEEHLHWVVLL